MSETSNDIASNIELHNQMWSDTFKKIANVLSGKSSDDSSSSSDSSTIVSDSGTKTTTDTTKKDTGTEIEDLKITEHVEISTFKMKIDDYLKEKGALNGAGSILESIEKESPLKINICVLIALSLWQTREGTTLAITDKHNPGCIPGSSENNNLADLTAGYKEMLKQLEAKMKDNDGDQLSSTRLWYVQKLISKDEAAGLEADDIKKLGANEVPKEDANKSSSTDTKKKDTSDSKKEDKKDQTKTESYDDKLWNQQIWWYNKLHDYVNDVYDKLLGAKPNWQKKTLNKNAKKDEKAKGRASDKGVKVEKKVPHGKHNEGDPDSLLVVLPKNETFSEPVYPDLLTVADNVPQYIKTPSTIKGPNNKFFDLGTGLTTNSNTTDSGDKVQNQNGTTSTTTTKDGMTVSVTKTDKQTEDNSSSKDTATSVEEKAKQIALNASVNIIDSSKIPDDKKDKNTTSTETKDNTNTAADTQGVSTVNNSVNQDTPSEPYVGGQPVSSGTADSALNAINQLTNNQLDDILGNMQDRLSRQIVYDPKKHKNSFKSPAKGKPANNNDAFPVDLKIEELELHYPHAYIHEIQACPQAVSTAKPLLEHAQATEKRIVKLENNMATLMRYFYALGGRIFINCTYFGGLSQYEKYKTIRCLKDNRLEDGQLMQLDQCLSCTRFEPIVGAVYEILNDKGANLCQIMDDNQMSYSNMNEYTKFVHTDEYTDQLKDYTTGSSNVKTRNPEDKDFKDYWSQGIKMDWQLVPVEKQKPHIGWRQSINDDGSYLKTHKLASYQYSADNNGSAFTKSAQNNVWIENKNAMDSNSDSTISQPIASGKSYSSDAIQDSINGMSAKDWVKAVKQQCASSGIKISATAVGCLAIAMGQDGNIAGVVNKIQSIESALSADNIDNQIITATCYALPDGTDYFLSTGSKKIDGTKSDTKDNTKKDNNSKDNTQTTTLDRANINKWKWVEFAPYLAKMNVSGLDLTPKICYTYSALNKYAGSSKFDTDQWGFPFAEDQIDSGIIVYSSGYGPRNGPNGSFHHGLDLCCPMGTEVHCVADGTVYMTQYGTNAGQILYIDHGNGTRSRYMHTSQMLVSEGQSVSRGDVVALSGNGDGQYAEHLHVELIVGDEWNGNINPAGPEGWPLFQTIEDGKAGKSFGASEHNLTEY
jgi:murein DD-endopeptidase MepM/ murein hydrolase activator NlpD